MFPAVRRLRQRPADPPAAVPFSLLSRPLRPTEAGGIDWVRVDRLRRRTDLGWVVLRYADWEDDWGRVATLGSRLSVGGGGKSDRRDVEPPDRVDGPARLIVEHDFTRGLFERIRRSCVVVGGVNRRVVLLRIRKPTSVLSVAGAVDRMRTMGLKPIIAGAEHLTPDVGVATSDGPRAVREAGASLALSHDRISRRGSRRGEYRRWVRRGVVDLVTVATTSRRGWRSIDRTLRRWVDDETASRLVDTGPRGWVFGVESSTMFEPASVHPPTCEPIAGHPPAGEPVAGGHSGTVAAAA